MNQSSYARMNAPYATLMCNVFRVQLYKNNAPHATIAYVEYPQFRLAAACAYCTRSV